MYFGNTVEYHSSYLLFFWCFVMGFKPGTSLQLWMLPIVGTWLKHPQSWSMATLQSQGLRSQMSTGVFHFRQYVFPGKLHGDWFSPFLKWCLIFSQLYFQQWCLIMTDYLLVREPKLSLINQNLLSTDMRQVPFLDNEDREGKMLNWFCVLYYWFNLHSSLSDSTSCS